MYRLGEVGKRIMERGKGWGLTQKELAEKIGHKRSMFLYGNRKENNKWENIVRMASVFGVSVDYILYGYVVDKDRLCLRKKTGKDYSNAADG